MLLARFNRVTMVLVGVLLVAGASAADVVYENETYTLTRDSIVEGDRRSVAHVQPGTGRLYLTNANAELVRPQLKGHYPTVTSESAMVDVLYRIALHDLEINIVDGDYFRVSPDFPNMIFTRDTAYSSYLGAAYVMPEMIQNHLRMTRRLRRELGFKCSKGLSIPLPGIDNQEEDLSNNDFFLKYGTHAFARRTDDVCWVAGYWESLCAKGDGASFKWLVDQFDYMDRHFYQKFYDPEDGLYHGQASFIDIGGTGYPESFAQLDCILVKALSTNSLYAGAFDRVAEACRRTGQPEKARRYQERSAALKKAIAKEFLHQDGYYAYFKSRQGELAARREQLGMAFLVLFDIVEPPEYRRAVGAYPFNDYGAPLFWPFYEFKGPKASKGIPHGDTYGDGQPVTKKVYHNNAIWPFANTLFNLAQFKTERTKERLLRTLGNLSRHALLGNFNEVLDYETGGGRVKHARSYIWSASAYLAVVFKMIAGIDLQQPDRVVFRPFLPAELGGSFRIEGLKVDNMTLDVVIEGNGGEVAWFSVDGAERPEPAVPRDDKHHVVKIHLE